MSTENGDNNNTRILLDQIDSSESPSRKQRYCAVCGKQLNKFLFLRRLRKSALYCSWECFTYKPPAIIQLEWQFGKDIKDILIETTKNYDTLEKQEQALDKSSQWLYSCIQKYFNMSLVEFMSKYATGARQLKYKRKWERELKKYETNDTSDDST